MVAIDCWNQEGMCRRSMQETAFPVVYAHTAGHQMLYSQGLREDELVGSLDQTATYSISGFHLGMSFGGKMVRGKCALGRGLGPSQPGKC